MAQLKYGKSTAELPKTPDTRHVNEDLTSVKSISDFYLQERKSILHSTILTLIFGPFGLYYSSIIGGVIMSFFPFLVFSLIFIMHIHIKTEIILICLMVEWFVCLIWGIISVKLHNMNTDKKIRDLETNAYF